MSTTITRLDPVSSEQHKQAMRARLRWISDMATDAYTRAGDPFMEINVVQRLINDIESSAQTARGFANLYEDAVDAEADDELA